MDMQDAVTGGAGMLHVLARIHAERDQTARPDPSVEYQNKAKITLHHMHINVYTINNLKLVQLVSSAALKM